MEGNRLRVQLHSIADTERLAEALAACLTVPMTLALIGSLGAGKTELVRRLCGKLGIPAETVTSPTYVLVQRYYGKLRVVHLDFYRLRSAEEAWDLGLDEWLVEPAVTIIEWADKFTEVLPEDVVFVHITPQADGTRSVDVSARGVRGQHVLMELQREYARGAGGIS